MVSWINVSFFPMMIPNDQGNYYVITSALKLDFTSFSLIVASVIFFFTVDSLPSSRFCVSLRSSSRLVWRLPVGTSLADDVSEDSSMEESVDSAESVTSFPRRWEQSERTSQ